MKAKPFFFLFLLLALSLSACLTSVHPLYTPETLRSDARLLGQWHEANFVTTQNGRTIQTDDNGFWHFDQKTNEEGQTFYRLTQLGEGSEEGDTAHFDVHILQLGDELFVDFYPEDVPMRNNFAAMMLFPGHIFARIAFEADRVHLHMFNGDWLMDLIQQNRIRISHEQSGDRILLTASTEELQKFVQKYAGEEKAYGDEIILSR
ncbi:MAG: hypothetical protein D6722_14390 [Bacteroidetes bacterium]|nr:MAG: hypothetical protein D6722_14390 [Bacteroidota bacterium]